MANRSARWAIFALIALGVATTLAPWLAPFPPGQQADIIALKNQPPSLIHPFGTDGVSRDLLSRLLYGGRVSLGVAVLAMLVSMVVATIYGAIAGFRGGTVDAWLMGLNDAALSVPRVLILLVVIALWDRLSIPALVLLIGLTGWFASSRLVRAQVMSVKQRDMVLAARALGASDARTLWRHILPNALPPVIVSATLGVGNVIALEAGLSFLGLGVQEPAASWGSIIHEGSQQVATLWWISLFPGMAIVLTVMAFNILGDGLRDALDPRQVVE